MPPRRRLTEAELLERFGIKPYEERIFVGDAAASAGPGDRVASGTGDASPSRVRNRKILWRVGAVGDGMVDNIMAGEFTFRNTKLGRRSAGDGRPLR